MKMNLIKTNDDENKELGDNHKIKTDVKTILEMDQMEIDHVDTAEKDTKSGEPL